MRLTTSWPQDLKDFIRPAGEVTYADVDRRGKGYKFYRYRPITYRVVDLESSADIANAVRKLDGIEFKGQKVRISEDPVPQPPIPNSCTLGPKPQSRTFAFAFS
jgi:RNA recognition motif-containing protein